MDKPYLSLPKVGDQVADNDGNVGTVDEVDGFHNVHVQYDDGGSGYHCLIPTCWHYDPLRKVE